MRPLLALVVAALALPTPGALAQEPTEVVILGVSHSAMLVAESYQPAAFRAFIERVDPDAICVERAPAELARGDHYEFTYEIQDLAVPFARERGIPLCPFDWMLPPEDQELAFGVVIEDPPFLRGAGSWANFLTFPDSAALERDLFYAEAESEREGARSWYLPMAERPRHDFARRLFLYRTFLQAMRIARAAREHPGGTVLVLVGSLHKDDLETILADERGVRVVPPRRFGAPSPEEVARHVRLPDLAAVATFNLLGAQSGTGILDREWVGRAVARLEAEAAGPEAGLLATRLGVVTGALAQLEAADRYAAIAREADPEARFTWDGVLDRRRLDSFADPFGNLTVARRARLEQARELGKAGRAAESREVLDRLAGELSPLQAAQLEAYAPEWLVP